jgi:hypothetical protein
MNPGLNIEDRDWLRVKNITMRLQEHRDQGVGSDV